MARTQAQRSEPAPARYTAQDIRRLIAARHHLDQPGVSKAPAEWLLFFELPNGAGMRSQNRYVDAFALNSYPSKQHWRVAYEIKVARGDFLAELNRPEKRAWAMAISHEFWFACAPGVARAEEIPDGCGLLEVRGDRLTRIRVAPQRQPRAFTDGEVAALARAGGPQSHFGDVRWRYAGCDLDDEGLGVLVAQHYDQAREAHWRAQAEHWYQDRITGFLTQISQVREALVAAGLPPMPWMTAIDQALEDPDRAVHHLGNWSRQQARDWVAQHVHPGPRARDVAEALEAQQAMTVRLDKIRDQINRALNDMHAQSTETENMLQALLMRD